MPRKGLFLLPVAFILTACGGTEEISSSLSGSTDSSLISSETDNSEDSFSSSSSSSVSVEDEREEDYAYEPILSEEIPSIYVTSQDETNNDFATVPNRENKWDYTDVKISVSNCEEAYQQTDVSAGFKVRGNYTANYEKKPFRIKFDKKQSLLGLNKGAKCKSWVLLADYKDSSLQRNSTAFYLGHMILGSDGYYTSDYRPVHLYINNTYWGMYLLCEQQQVNENRIAISEPEEDGSNTAIGYLLEYDGYYSEEPSVEEGGDPTFTIDYHDNDSLRTINGSWKTPYQPGFTVKSDILSANQLTFIQNYMDNLYDLFYEAVVNRRYYQFEEDYSSLSLSLTCPNALAAVAKYIDIDSLVDMYLLSEIACDSDLSWSSFFMSIDFSSESPKLRFEAPWDYDSAFGLKKGICESGEGYYASEQDMPWLILATKMPGFLDKVKAKWQELDDYGILKSSLSYIDTYAEMYAEDYAENFTRWPNSIGYNPYVDSEVREVTRSFKKEKEAATFLKNWLYKRYNSLSTLFGDNRDVITEEPLPQASSEASPPGYSEAEEYVF